MHRLLVLAPLLAACAADPAAPPGDITGTISADETWSGTRTLSGFVVIDRGVTVTVAPGTTIQVATGASIDVEGALVADGTKDAPIALVPAVEGQVWLGLNVTGAYTLHHGKQVGGGIFTVAPSATVEVFDSELANSLGDFIVMNDGSIDIEYTNLGVEMGNHTHCNVHINSAQHVTFTHNNNVGVAYGLMLYGGTGDFSHTNWYANETDIEPHPAGTGTFDGGYFAKGTPGGIVGSSFANLSPTPLADCGPR